MNEATASRTAASSPPSTPTVTSAPCLSPSERTDSMLAALTDRAAVASVTFDPGKVLTEARPAPGSSQFSLPCLHIIDSAPAKISKPFRKKAIPRRFLPLPAASRDLDASRRRCRCNLYDLPIRHCPRLLRRRCLCRCSHLCRLCLCWLFLRCNLCRLFRHSVKWKQLNISKMQKINSPIWGN